MSRVHLDKTGIELVERESAKRTVTLAGARAGIQVLNKAAKAAAPKASGALRTAQGYLAKKGRKGKTLSFGVQGARKATVKMVRRPGRKTPQKAVPAFYDHLVNLGVRPHAVGKGSVLARAGKKFGRSRSGRLVRQVQTGKSHPGAPADPFRRRAWAASERAAGEATVDAMIFEVQKHLVTAAARRTRGK